MDDPRDPDRQRPNETTRHPDRSAFREAVEHEDPSGWGRRDMSPMGPAVPPDRAMRSDFEGMTTPTTPPRTTAGSSYGSTGTPVDKTIPDAPTTTRAIGTTGATTGTMGGMDKDRDRRVDAFEDDRGMVSDRGITERTVGTAPAAYTRDNVEPPVGRRRFSIGATFLGWAVASFFSLVFLSIVAGLVGPAGVEEATTGIDRGDLANFATVAGIGALVATFLAFLVGGYAAGRIALWDGIPHGLGIVGWAILFGILALVMGTTMGDEFVALTGYDLDVSNITGAVIVGIVLTLVAMLAGAALGGRIGERYHDRVHGIEPARRRTLRGRPL